MADILPPIRNCLKKSRRSSLLHLRLLFLPDRHVVWLLADSSTVWDLIKDFVPLAKLEDVVFGGWDVYEDNVYEAASKAQVLEQGQLDAVKAELEAIQPMKAVFDP